MFNCFLKNIYKLTLLGLVLILNILSVQSQSSLPVGQQLAIINNASTPYYSFTRGLDSWKLGLPQVSRSTLTANPPSLLDDFRSTQTALPTYNVNHLAFFCRLEVHLEKATKIPVRFRLGDVQQVDYLEGKFTGWRYGY